MRISKASSNPGGMRTWVPSKTIEPPSQGIKPSVPLSSVVLAQPYGPTTVTISFASI